MYLNSNGLDRMRGFTALKYLTMGGRRVLALALRFPAKPAYAARLQLAENGLEAAADALQEIMSGAEDYWAVQTREWQESAKGRQYEAVLSEMAATVSGLRALELPDVSILR